MKKVILLKVIGHDCSSYDCCHPDPTIIPASEWTELEDSDYEALAHFVNVYAHKYTLLEALSHKNNTDSHESISTLIQKGRELIANEKARKEAIEKKLAKQKANKEKNALLIKQKKLEKLQKEVEDLKKNGN